MRINLHTHTRRCDGEAGAEEIVRAAIEAGLSHVGVTDHLDSEKLRPLFGVAPAEVADYAGEVKALAARYSDRITVLAGIEVDFSRDRTDFGAFLTAEAAAKTFGALDFALFEYVGDPLWRGDGLDLFFDLRRHIPVPVGLAHPDILATFFGLIPRAAAGILARNQVFLELCPASRNAVLAPAKGADGERIEEEIIRLGTAMEKAEQDAEDNPALRAPVAALAVKMDLLRAQCKRAPSYRVGHRFIRGFFDEAKRQSVLLSVGTDSHDASSVGDVEDAAAFIEERGLGANLVTEHFWKR